MLPILENNIHYTTSLQYWLTLLTNKKNTYKIDMDIHKLQKTIAEKVHT